MLAARCGVWVLAHCLMEDRLPLLRYRLRCKVQIPVVQDDSSSQPTTRHSGSASWGMATVVAQCLRLGERLLRL